jgi:hypothetical protein
MLHSVACRGYVRYVDDLLLFDDNKRRLGRWRDEIRRFLGGLRLRLHPRKSEIFPIADGMRSMVLTLSGMALATGVRGMRFPAKNPRLAPCGSGLIGTK